MSKFHHEFKVPKSVFSGMKCPLRMPSMWGFEFYFDTRPLKSTRSAFKNIYQAKQEGAVPMHYDKG
jgi:hypothetical protein